MQPFTAAQASANGLNAADDVFELVDSTFADETLIRAWSFDAPIERQSAMALAQSNADALLPVVPACQLRWKMARRFPKTMDADLYRMKRCVADALATGFSATATPPGGRLRVVVMVPWLPNNPNNNILRVAAGYHAGLFRHRDVEDAVLLVTNENAVAATSRMPEARLDARGSRLTHASVVQEFGAPADRLLYAPPPFLDGGNFAWHQEFIANFRPNVLFVPNVEMTSAYAHAFAKTCATIYLQTSVRNRPPYDFDRYLYLGERRTIDRSHIHPDRWHYHSFGYENFGTGSSLSRSQIGLGVEDFVLVTAGNRLEIEINQEIVDIVHQVMTRAPHVKWMMLGVQNEAKIRQNLGAAFDPLIHRVIFKGYVKDIGDHLALADIYANPRRTGGAVSMALAIYGHTPVITFVGNDAGTFIVDELICRTPDEYANLLGDLANDHARLALLDTEQQRRFMAGHTIAASVDDLVGHIHEAVKARGARS